METPIDAISEACEVVGGQAELARLLELTPSAVNQWCRGLREVPAERCPQIEELTDARGRAVRCERLRPDVRWEVVRNAHPQAA